MPVYREWARHDIRVNALAPGFVRTEMNDVYLDSEAGRAKIMTTPQCRYGTPEELDRPLLLLASTAGSYITSSVLVVDGGHLVTSL